MSKSSSLEFMNKLNINKPDEKKFIRLCFYAFALRVKGITERSEVIPFLCFCTEGEGDAGAKLRPS
jgi:hypothetical protein